MTRVDVVERVLFAVTGWREHDPAEDLPADLPADAELKEFRVKIGEWSGTVLRAWNGPFVCAVYRQYHGAFERLGTWTQAGPLILVRIGRVYYAYTVDTRTHRLRVFVHPHIDATGRICLGTVEDHGPAAPNDVLTALLQINISSCYWTPAYQPD